VSTLHSKHYSISRQRFSAVARGNLFDEFELFSVAELMLLIAFFIFFAVSRSLASPASMIL